MNCARSIFMCFALFVCSAGVLHCAEAVKPVGVKPLGEGALGGKQAVLPKDFFTKIGLEVRIADMQGVRLERNADENLERLKNGNLNKSDIVVVKNASDASPEKVGLLCEVTLEQFQFSNVKSNVKFERTSTTFIQGKNICRASYKLSYSDGSKWNKLGTGTRNFLLCRDYYSQFMSMFLDEIVDVRGVSTEVNPSVKNETAVRGTVLLKKKSPFIFSEVTLCAETVVVMDADRIYDNVIRVSGFTEPGKSVKFSQAMPRFCDFMMRAIAYDYNTTFPFRVSGLALAPDSGKVEDGSEKTSGDSGKSSQKGKPDNSSDRQ